MPPNPVITNVEVPLIILQGEQFVDSTVTFAAAGTAKAGLILALVAGKFVPFVIGGTGGTEIPSGILTYDLTVAGAGDAGARVLVAGVVNKNRLIVAADGSGINITPGILAQLRDYSIIAVEVASLGAFDNPSNP